MPDRLLKSLAAGIEKLELEIPAASQQRLINYLQLILKWNQVYNLTAIRDAETMLTKHLLDSLSIVPYIHGKRILDVGSGAGLPGIPLAIALPEKSFTLLDKNGKKTRFLTQVKAQLALSNLEVVHEKVEAYQSPQCFDVITTRAFALISGIIESTKHLCCEQGCLAIMKGRYPKVELLDLPGEFEVHELHVPGLHEMRHLVMITGVGRG